MKILHTTDLHFNKEWFSWIEEQQPHFDVFCITGDFLESSKEETLKEQIEWISAWLRKFQKPLFVCSGNHDIEELENEDWLNKIPNVYSDNNIKTISGIKFGSIPYIAPEFLEFDECKVILYHLPPANTKTAIHKTTNEDWGDEEMARLLQKKILRPNVLFCGHMHHPIQTQDIIHKTTIYNCGSNKNSKVPNYNIITIGL